MFSNVYQAMTPCEMESALPERVAYMACHFSPYGKGLSNMPAWLPTESILLLDDSMPIDGHDPELICKQVQELVLRFSVKAVLADFQLSETEASLSFVSALAGKLSCPFGVTEVYAKKLDCPVFLPPTPVNASLEEYLSPWLSHGVFLEVAPESLQITVTETGSKFTALPAGTTLDLPLIDNRLHCHYQVNVSPDNAVFTLSRAKEDLCALADEAYRLGVLGVIGLYQELQFICQKM